jgi:hypothetical protein
VGVDLTVLCRKERMHVGIIYIEVVSLNGLNGLHKVIDKNAMQERVRHIRQYGGAVQWSVLKRVTFHRIPCIMQCMIQAVLICFLCHVGHDDFYLLFSGVGCLVCRRQLTYPPRYIPSSSFRSSNKKKLTNIMVLGASTLRWFRRKPFLEEEKQKCPFTYKHSNNNF